LQSARFVEGDNNDEGLRRVRRVVVVMLHLNHATERLPVRIANCTVQHAVNVKNITFGSAGD
jgi:hypothetical protein